jgi:hypothetical protein
MEGNDVAKTISLEQGASFPRQAEVSIPAAGVPAAGNAPTRSKARAAESAGLCLILCIVFNFWITPERASALIAQSGASPVGSRFTSDREFTSGRPGDLAVPNAPLLGGGNGILQNLGVALFVSGLSPYMPQDSAQQPGLPDQCASVRESNECRLAGDQHRFPLYLQILASVLLCGLISWGDAAWIAKR